MRYLMYRLLSVVWSAKDNCGRPFGTDWGEYRFFSDVVKNAVKTRYDIGRIGGGVQQPEFPQEQIRRFQKPCQQENPYFTRDLGQR